MSELDVDVVVAGAGGGMVGALRAAELGSRVLLVETSEHFRRGNNTSMSTAMFPGAGSRWQRELGIEDSPETFAADIRKKTKGSADPLITQTLTNVSAELVEWMADSQGVDLHLVTDFHYPGHSVDRCHSIEGRKGDRVLAHLLSRIEAHDNIDMLVPARLMDVEVMATEGGEGDAVTAIIEMPDGSQERIVTSAVIMATNGFGANTEMVQRFIPEIASAVYHGSDASRGDAIRIGERYGAQPAFLDAYQGHAALAVHGSTLAGWATIMHGSVLVNTDGRRFGDETCGYSEYAAMLAAQPGARGWLILDERVHDACMAFRDYQETVDSGALRRADDVAGLAAVLEVDESVLAATLDAADAAARGEGPDEFGRTFFEDVLRAPYVAIKVQPALFHTQGGLLVNGDAQVLRADGTTVPGLYAAGGAAAGISGHGADGYLAGNGLLSAFGLSYLAGQAASRITASV
jgi:fumarate reductase flavoprotein subunit